MTRCHPRRPCSSRTSSPNFRLAILSTTTAMIPSRDSIPTPRRRLSLVVAGMCSTASLVLAVAGCQTKAKPQAGTRHPKVIVVVSKKMTMPIVVNPIATTRALNDVAIRARVKGFLEEKHFDDGRNVKKGDLLLVIEEKPYQVRLELAKAELAAAEAALKKAKASKANIISKASLELDMAQLRLDEVEERREQILLSRKAVSQEDYDKAQAQRKKAPPRSMPIAPASSRPRPTTRSTSKTHRPRSPVPRAPLMTPRSI